MTSEAPYPITNELLQAHAVYQRAQAILTDWHTNLVQDGPCPEKTWRQDHLNTLDTVAGKGPPDTAEWYFNVGRRMTIQRMLYEFVRCTYHEEPDERMEAWRTLQETVVLWDEKFSCDDNVA